MNSRRAIPIIGGIALVLMLAFVGVRQDIFRGSLLNAQQIAAALKSRADANHDNVLSVREIRSTLIAIIRGVITGNPQDDINGDGVVNRADIASTTQGFRSLLTAFCGNGVPEADEECDDANGNTADGCSIACTADAGFLCTGSPSVCSVRTDEPVLAINMLPMPAQNTTFLHPEDNALVMTFSVTAWAKTPVVLQSIPVQITDGSFNNTDGYHVFDTENGTSPEIGVGNSAGNLLTFNQGAGRTIPAGQTETYYVLTHLHARQNPTTFQLSFPASMSIGAADTTIVLRTDRSMLTGFVRTDGTCSQTPCIVDLATSLTTIWTAPTYCGDGFVAGYETCDDGNTTASDGCSATCAVESGYSCDTATPNVCTRIPVCGDGIREGSETCDDGNTTASDGCSATCTVESGYSCTTATPNVCTHTPVCGDGLIEGSESCDDGNTVDGDGCNAACAVEVGYACGSSPSTCARVLCSNGIDDDNDGGIDVPGSLASVTQDAGHDIDGVMPPYAMDSDWYYAPFSTTTPTGVPTYELGIWSFQNGQFVTSLPSVSGFSSGRVAYDEPQKILYEYSGPYSTQFFKVHLNGPQSSHLGTYTGPGGNYAFYGAKLSADGTKLYALFQSNQTNPANRGPALFVEISTATMQMTRQVMLSGLSSVDGKLSMVYDATRSAMYLFDQHVSDTQRLDVREINLSMMMDTGRVSFVDGDPIADIEFDEEGGNLFYVQNPVSYPQTVLYKLSVYDFSLTNLTIHNGSSITMDGQQYTKLQLNLLWARTATNRLVALANYGTAYPWSRSFFMIFDTVGSPVLQETYTDVPTFSAAGNSPEYIPRAIDSIRGVVYLEPYAPTSPTPTWHVIAPERHAVVSKTTFELLGNASFHAIPVDWEPSRPLSMDQNAQNVIILPGFTLPGSYHVWPPFRINAGDAACTDPSLNSES